MQAHDSAQLQGRPKGQQYKVVHLKAEVIDFFSLFFFASDYRSRI